MSGTFLQSFGFAFRGLADAWRKERNFRVQCVYTGAVVGLLLWLQPEPALALVAFLGMAVLLGAELMNSALERAVDLSVTEFHPLAGSAKDLAASSVLVVAMATAVINLWVIGGMVIPSARLAFATYLVGAGALRFAPSVLR